MIIDTNYQIGNIVWFMHQNKPYCSSITSICIYVSTDTTSVLYHVADNERNGWELTEEFDPRSQARQFTGDTFFRTKEDLIKSL